MDKKTPAKTQSAAKPSTAAQKNLSDIKQALEHIMQATAANSTRQTTISDAANLARLHSFASDAYAHLLGMMAKSK